jgi:hypothetical protein
MPDDGEWECVDIDGVVYCREVGPSAGVVPGARDLGWMCGTRRGYAEHVCVDLAPDLPDADHGWDCRFDHDAGERRVCMRSTVPRVGARCVAKGVCPANATCSEGVCLPSLPRPACWFDADCERGQLCRFASCIGEQP